MLTPVRPALLLLLTSALALSACGGDEATSGAGGAGTTGSGGSSSTGVAPVRPEDPQQNDPAFTVVGAPRYLLAGDGLTPATPSFELRVTAPAGVTDLDLWLDDGEAAAFMLQGGDFVLQVPASALALGAHTLLLSERGAKTAFFKADFVKGHALYVVISTDWDFPDVDDRVLDHHEALHQAHPELVITHLIGPYTFTDPAIPQARRDTIVTWAKGMRDGHADEIGLHIHPRCTFVEAAGLPCLSQPSVQTPAGDPTGYTVHLGAYSRVQWNTMFAKADAIWADLGFGKPTSFRAGAWTLETHVAQALTDAGFVVDSSAVNWPYLEEWMGYDLYDWNKKQWDGIGDTSQPYHPTDQSVLPAGAGAPLALLELPDNGVMVDYWTVAEMKAIFDANWSGQSLEAPIQVSTGFHPAPTEYYSKAEYKRLDTFFTYVDQFLASKLLGPVRYIRMSDATQVW